MQAQLVELQAQIDQSTANSQAIQAHALELQQAIEADASAYQKELDTLQANMAKAEQQIQQEIEATKS